MRLKRESLHKDRLAEITKEEEKNSVEAQRKISKGLRFVAQKTESKEKIRKQKVFEEIIAETFPMLMKYINKKDLNNYINELVKLKDKHHQTH